MSDCTCTKYKRCWVCLTWDKYYTADGYCLDCGAWFYAPCTTNCTRTKQKAGV